MIDSSTHAAPSLVPSIVVTADGSHTLYDFVTGEHYHSMGGAITESLHVFIKNGLVPMLLCNNMLHVYETGLGTGLNALLTCIEAYKQKKFIHYHACELYPLAVPLALQLNYPALVEHSEAADFYRSIHTQQWDGEPRLVHRHFALSKNHCDISQMCFRSEQLHLVYYDAFSSKSQPELWRTTLLRSLAKSMLPGSVLVTYATAGVVKEGLRHAGFRVQRLPGAAGKREMLKATKI